MYCLATKRTKKISRRKREREFFQVSFFQTDNQASTDRVTFCYSLTS